MKQTIFSQCLTASSRITIPIHHFISYLRNLFYIPLLFCTAMVISNSAFASFKVGNIDIDEHSYGEATIHFSGSLPTNINGFNNVRIVKTDFYLGGVPYPVSSNQARVGIRSLDDSSLQQAQVNVTYKLSLAFGIAEWGNCLSRHTTWEWTWYGYWPVTNWNRFYRCASNVWQAVNKDQLHVIYVRESLDTEIARSTSNIKLELDGLAYNYEHLLFGELYGPPLSSESHLFRFVFEQSMIDYFRENMENEGHYDDYQRSFTNRKRYNGYVSARKQMYPKIFNIWTAYNSKRFLEAVLGKINEQALNKADGRLEMAITAFLGSDCLEKLPQQLRALMPIYNQTDLTKIAKNLTDYVCQYNQHQFTRKWNEASISEPVQFNNQGGNDYNSDFKPYFFCSKYLCKFKVSMGESYLVLEPSLVFESLPNYLSPSFAGSTIQSIMDVCSTKTCSIIDSNILSQYLEQEVQASDGYAFYKKTVAH